MDVKNYLERASIICKKECMTLANMLNDIGITWPTYKKLRDEEKVMMGSLRKLKIFVDGWEAKNMSVKD